MTPLIILAVLVLVLVFAVSLLGGRLGGGEKEKSVYDYKRKQFFLTRAEHEFYDALVAAVGQEYHVFAQVHLASIVDHKVTGQNWRGAFRHINEKSVDFVLCDKAYISPKLAIELDDRTHERPDRKERDVEVERVLKSAKVPLLRLPNNGRFDPADLKQRVKELVSR